MKGPPVEGDAPASSPSSQRDVDFSDYMWMGEEMEEFDKKCILEFCEEEFIESCFEELFEEEDRFAEELEQYLENLTPDQVNQLVHQMDSVTLNESSAIDKQLASEEKTLNPDAPLFVPQSEQEGDESCEDK